MGGWADNSLALGREGVRGWADMGLALGREGMGYWAYLGQVGASDAAAVNTKP